MSTRNLLVKHTALLAELTAHEPKIEAVSKQVDKLIDDGNG